MRLLILGGTVFLGRYLVEGALARGHRVTLFNRGQHNPDLFPGVEKLRGDRSTDLRALMGHSWDAVIDTCGFVPRVVQASAELLADVVDHYTFISTASVYRDFRTAHFDETYPLATLPEAVVADLVEERYLDEKYGPLKALCEQTAARAMPGRVLTIRPGLIVGPYDPSDRFTYWPHRVAQGKEVLAPGRPEEPRQFIDVRDLAQWTLRLVEAGQTGIFNATGPEQAVTMGAFLEECQQVSGSTARFVWVEEAFLFRAGIAPWTELPLWIPQSEHENGFWQMNIDQALATGLTFRPLTETIRDTLDWAATRPLDWGWAAGLTPTCERQLLAKWRGDVA
ncbi:SDR family oxidoreductase [Anthocerotibacter panamensis]|uniref:SDR family oxidoreductase n=1 Tax=Anthocerotibacter panamensis TaxID=2857077 RepID=UPI001C4065BD|nr:SDR family oxidoreductase [Anthocerotibacter panamensis]